MLFGKMIIFDQEPGEDFKPIAESISRMLKEMPELNTYVRNETKNRWGGKQVMFIHAQKMHFKPDIIKQAMEIISQEAEK